MPAPLVKMRDASGTLRTMTRIRVRDAGSVLRTITRIRMRDESGALRIVYDPSGASTLAVTVDDPVVWGSSTGTGTATTSVTTATPTGGTAPYTYLWAVDTYTASVAPGATASTSAATAFLQSSMDPSGVYTSEFILTVTDANGNTAQATVTANFADF